MQAQQLTNLASRPRPGLVFFSHAAPECIAHQLGAPCTHVACWSFPCTCPTLSFHACRKSAMGKSNKQTRVGIFPHNKMSRYLRGNWERKTKQSKQSSVAPPDSTQLTPTFQPPFLLSFILFKPVDNLRKKTTKLPPKTLKLILPSTPHLQISSHFLTPLKSSSVDRALLPTKFSFSYLKQDWNKVDSRKDIWSVHYPLALLRWFIGDHRKMYSAMDDDEQAMRYLWGTWLLPKCFDLCLCQDLGRRDGFLLLICSQRKNGSKCDDQVTDVSTITTCKWTSQHQTRHAPLLAFMPCSHISMTTRHLFHVQQQPLMHEGAYSKPNDAKKLLVCIINNVSVFSTAIGLQMTSLKGHMALVTFVIVVPASNQASKVLWYRWTASLDAEDNKHRDLFAYVSTEDTKETQENA